MAHGSGHIGRKSKQLNSSPGNHNVRYLLEIQHDFRQFVGLSKIRNFLWNPDETDEKVPP